MINECTASDLAYMVGEFNDYFVGAYESNEALGEFEFGMAEEVYNNYKEYCEQNQIKWDYEFKLNNSNYMQKVFKDALSQVLSQTEAPNYEEEIQYADEPAGAEVHAWPKPAAPVRN